MGHAAANWTTNTIIIVVCASITGGGVDRLSTLPDKILHVTLSFLSLREAASTSVLSSRWFDLWKYTRNLNFTEDIFKSDFDTRIPLSWVYRVLKSWDVEKCKYVELVNSVLQSHKAPSVKHFSTSFYVDKTALLKVAKWLEFASLKGVERLELDFKCEDLAYQILLEELLRGSGLRQTDDINVIFFRSLKSLRLSCLVVSGEAIKMLLRNCPLLEALIIGFVTLTSDVEVCGSGDTLKLKHLQIYCCKGNKSIIVSAPNLVSLMVNDTTGKLVLKNVPELVEADIWFGHGNLDGVRHLASEVFRFASQLKTLKLTLKNPEIFWVDGVFPQMPNLNKLFVVYSGVRTQSLLPVTTLLRVSPRLEEFKFMLSTDIISGVPVQAVRDVERSPHRHLKLFDLGGFKNGDVHCVELANYILDNCVALEKIIIRPRPSIRAFGSGKPFVDDTQAAIDYAKQQLQGKIPQHVELAI